MLITVFLTNPIETERERGRGRERERERERERASASERNRVYIYIYIYIYIYTHTHSTATLLGTPVGGEDDLLKFKQSIRMGKKGDLSDFERGMVVGARRAGVSI